MELNETEWGAWRAHPVTQEFFKCLSVFRRQIKDAWADGAYTSDTVEKTAQLNAEALGKVSVLSYLLDSDINLIERMKDE